MPRRATESTLPARAEAGFACASRRPRTVVHTDGEPLRPSCVQGRDREGRLATARQRGRRRKCSLAPGRPLSHQWQFRVTRGRQRRWGGAGRDDGAVPSDFWECRRSSKRSRARRPCLNGGRDRVRRPGWPQEHHVQDKNAFLSSVGWWISPKVGAWRSNWRGWPESPTGTERGGRPGRRTGSRAPPSGAMRRPGWRYWGGWRTGCRWLGHARG